eukprot:12209822-Alexandrium_andersonii.AAC.1
MRTSGFHDPPQPKVVPAQKSRGPPVRVKLGSAEADPAWEDRGGVGKASDIPSQPVGASERTHHHVREASNITP